MSSDSRDILIAAITAPHGIDGSVRLKVFSDNISSLKRYGTFRTDRGQPLTLRSVRPQGDMAIARFAEIPDRTAADSWRGTKLLVDRAALPLPAENETYHADLLGMKVRTSDGTEIGEVIDVPNYGAGDLLEIRRAAADTLLIPYRNVAVLEVDVVARCITVDAAFVL